jgi:flavin reductase (DIM6/NTAB) family NADH-FMN oxidoreductase RutF
MAGKAMDCFRKSTGLSFRLALLPCRKKLKAMKNHSEPGKWISLDTSQSIWGRFFTVAPLVVIGTKEGNEYDLAPKHMVTPLGHDNYFGFVCTPGHATYHNVKQEKTFSVSFVTPSQVVLTSLTATPRCDERPEIPAVRHIPTVPAREIDALVVEDAYLCLECTLDRIIDGFGDFSLIAGEIVAAYVREEALRLSEVDDAHVIEDMPLLAYLAYGRFAEIKTSTPFPFPKDFDQKVLTK